MDIILSKNTNIYHGSCNPTLQMENKPTWFAFDKDTAKSYGPYIYSYRIIQDLKLINIGSLQFHSQYLDLLNRVYTGKNYNGIDERKLIGSIPLGLPNLSIQVQYLKDKGVKINDLRDWLKPENVQRYGIASSFFSDKHRYSSYEKDKEMIKILQDLYKSYYHGYSTKVMWPSKLHDGLFNKELCIFQPTLQLKLESIGGNRKKKFIIGGGDESCPIIVNGDTWNRHKGFTKDEWDKLDYLVEDIDQEIVLECLGNNTLAVWESERNNR